MNKEQHHPNSLRAAVETHLRWLRFHVTEPHVFSNEAARISYQHAADMLQALLTEQCVTDGCGCRARQDEMVHQACAATIQMFGGTMAIQAANYMAECLLDKLPASGVSRICAERCRQMQIEGWTPRHDDAHEAGELVAAAVCYAEAGSGFDLEISPRVDGRPMLWPWESSWWKPSEDLTRNLVRAGALIAAEIDMPAHPSP